MLELCQEHQLIVANGCTASDPEGNFTFVGGQGSSVNDFCAISGAWINIFRDLLVDMKNYSDHLPLVIHTSCNLQHNVRCIKLLPKLQWNAYACHIYQRRLDEFLDQNHRDHLDVNETANLLTKAINNSAVASNSGVGRQQGWFDTACKKARERSFAWLNLFRKTNSDACRQLYVEANMVYKRVCAAKKTEYYTQISRDLSTSKNSATFWKNVKILNGNNLKIGTNLDPSLLVNHFRSLLSPDEREIRLLYAPNYTVNDMLDNCITLEELNQVLAKAKCKKAPGYDRIPYEFLKNATAKYYDHLLNLYNDILVKEKVPESFKEAIIFPILKKGDPSNPENYRGISFLNTISKVFAGIILGRLEKFVAQYNLLSEAQAGFRVGYSTIDHIFTLTNLMHLTAKRGRKMYTVFVDFKAAFDRIDRKLLIYKLRALNLSSKIVKIIEQLYLGTSAVVWNGDELSDWFETLTGVRQGCVLSPLLFALFINDIVEHLPGGVNVNGYKINVLLYADDIVLLAETPEMLQMMLNKLEEYCGMWGLEVNILKTKAMIFNKRGRKAKSEKWFFNGAPVEVVQTYKYLGITMTPLMNAKIHLREKLKASINSICTTWRNLFRAESVTHSDKYKVFLAAVKSIMFYGAEVWGFEAYEEVEKLLRYYIKRYFLLPKCTPNYMIMLETGLPPLFIETLKLHFSYLLRVLRYPDTRLARITLKIIAEKNIGWHQNLQRLAISSDLMIDIGGDCDILRDQMEIILRKTDLNKRNEYILQARNSQSRFLYSTLSYEMSQKNYFKDGFSRKMISTLLRARGELLKLNYQPYGTNENCECNLCNLKAREDVLHFIGKCPILRELRLLHLGKRTLSLEETREVLNGKCWNALMNYCTQASDYRNEYAS